MADIFSTQKRSEIMSKISSKETKPEIYVRKHLFAKGFRFRKNDKRLPGKPDVVLPKYKTVIFVNGCFWHGHTECKKAKLPETRKEFWADKIKSNIERDERDLLQLQQMGWNVLVVWGCKLSDNTDSVIRTLELLKAKL